MVGTMTIKYKKVSKLQYRSKEDKRSECHPRSRFFDDIYLCMEESICFFNGEESRKDESKLHATSDVEMERNDEKTSNCETPKISPEYLLKDTSIRRVTKSVGSRFWFIHILHTIDEYSQNYQAYLDEMKVNVPVFTQIQVDAFRVLNYDVFGYQLSDGSLGFSFRDNTNLILLSDFRQMYYIKSKPRPRISYFKDKASAPSCLQGKLAQVSVFENIARAYSEAVAEGVMTYDVPFLVKWLRFVGCSVMYFSNGTLEILFHSGRKVVISPFVKPICISEKGTVGLVSQNDMQLILFFSKRLLHGWFASSTLRWFIFPVPSLS